METLRYYEELGLISTPIRSESGYRLYSEAALSRLTFIHNAKRCGFTLKEIKKALRLMRFRPVLLIRSFSQLERLLKRLRMLGI
nr:MerR family transcriptional regulator [Paenibacillus etheri]